MRKLFLIISIVVLVIAVYLGIQTLTEINFVVTQNRSLEKANQESQAKLDNLKDLVKSIPRTLKDNYYDLYNDLMAISSYTGSSCLVSIPGSKEGESIEKYFLDSTLTGVKVVNLEINFNKLADFDSKTFVLESISEIRSKFPAAVSNVQISKEEIKLSMTLFGV